MCSLLIWTKVYNTAFFIFSYFILFSFISIVWLSFAVLHQKLNEKDSGPGSIVSKEQREPQMDKMITTGFWWLSAADHSNQGDQNIVRSCRKSFTTDANETEVTVAWNWFVGECGIVSSSQMWSPSAGNCRTHTHTSKPMGSSFSSQQHALIQHILCRIHIPMFVRTSLLRWCGIKGITNATY